MPTAVQHIYPNPFTAIHWTWPRRSSFLLNPCRQPNITLRIMDGFYMVYRFYIDHSKNLKISYSFLESKDKFGGTVFTLYKTYSPKHFEHKIHILFADLTRRAASLQEGPAKDHMVGQQRQARRQDHMEGASTIALIVWFNCPAKIKMEGRVLLPRLPKSHGGPHLCRPVLPLRLLSRDWGCNWGRAQAAEGNRFDKIQKFFCDPDL